MLDPQSPSPNVAQISPFIELGRADWAALAPSMPSPLRETEIVQLRGLGEPLDLKEVAEVYLPLSRLLNLYVGGTKSLIGAMIESYLQEGAQPIPTNAADLTYGVSITDPCISWETTERMLRWGFDKLAALPREAVAAA